MSLEQTYAQLRAEIERLQFDIADKTELIVDLRIEIERLRADRDSWRIAARSWEERTKRAEARRALEQK